ncbi:hypothetical protein LTS17_003199 [Exophiala oligosperma]
MTSRSMWIERGPDGRPYFVRSKERLPSTRQLLAEVLFPRRARSLFVRQSHQINLSPRSLEQPAPRDDPPDTETPNPAPTPGPSNMPPPSQSQPQPVNMYLMPAQQQDNEHPQLQGQHSMTLTQQNPQFPPPFVPPMQFLPPHIPPTFPLPSLQQPVVFGVPPATFTPPQPGLPNGIPGVFNGPGLHPMPAQMPGLRQSHTPTVPQSRPAELRYKYTITRTQSLRDSFLQELFVASVEKPRLTRKMARATVHLPIGLLGRMGVEHQDQDPVKHRE